MLSGNSRRSRHGFTLVELLVVIAIIGVLMSLVLPATSSARGLARQLQCKNKLKQLATAVLNYGSQHEAFPPFSMTKKNGGTFSVAKEAKSTRPGSNGTSWIFEILPFMERDDIADRWDIELSVIGNAEIAQTDLQELYCPSRRSGIRQGTSDVEMMFENWTSGGTDYGALLSSRNTWHNQWPHRVFMSAILSSTGRRGGPSGMDTIGILIPNKPSSLSIQDGASNTVMLGELQRIWDPSKENGGRPTSGPQARRSEDGWAVGSSGVGFSTYFDADHANNSGGINAYHFEAPGSDHVGGANFARGDGSIEFINEVIDPDVLQSMGSRNGGESMKE